ncbi:MAG: hypothetical protein MK033_09275 [Candidatus Caenarcaniphilales bacterium]|nr:hypothetical protein [Candidatus Caenarcaniphilales bacterium]
MNQGHQKKSWDLDKLESYTIDKEANYRTDNNAQVFVIPMKIDIDTGKRERLDYRVIKDGDEIKLTINRSEKGFITPSPAIYTFSTKVERFGKEKDQE